MFDSTNLERGKGYEEIASDGLKEENKVKSQSFHIGTDTAHAKKGLNTQNDVQLSAKTTIPCLYLPYAQGSSKVMIYFHGNAEDVGLASELLDYIRSLLRVSNPLN